MTVLPRAATSPELVKLRADNQSTRLYLTAHQPATVYTARLAAVPSSTDQVTAITYNTGSGTHTNILSDQTLLVGSSAGAFDYGQCRIRNTTGIGATTGTFNIGEASEVNWTAGAYLTVLDEFVPWAKHLRTVGTSVYMDYDVAYTDQHSKCDSVPVLGPSRVAWLRDATVTLAFDASQSWVLNNTITGYAWTFTGAASSTGTTTATPTATYNAAGTYRVACAITNSDGKTFTGYRYVFIVTEATAIDQFSLGSVRGDFNGGGWSFDVTLYAQADRVTVRDRALMILHAVDYYGDTAGSVGYVAGSENVIAIGWLAGDTIDWQPQDKGGSVSFAVQGLHYWLDKMSGFPVGLKDQNSAPTKWTKFFGLTCRAVTWHMLHWRSTLTRFTDVFACDESHRAARIEAPGAQTLWQQLNTMLDTAILAKSCCDRYGRLFNQIEQQLLSTAEKASIPSVMTITGADWTGQIDIERRPTPECSLVDFSGVSFDGATATPYCSLSPGHVFKQFGTPDLRERLIFDSQTIANQRAGAYCGWKNNPYPRISISLPSNNRLIDLAPWQWVTINIATADTVRAITASSLRLIPRSIEYNHQDGYLTSRVEFEAESTAEISVTNVRPTPVITPIEVITPPPPPPPPVPIPTASGKEVWLWHYNASATPSMALIYSTDFFSALGSPTWHTVASLPANLAFIIGGSIRADGTQCYIVGRDSITSRNAIWRCANPKAGSPTWVQDITSGQTYGTFGGTSYAFDSLDDYAETVDGYQSIFSITTTPSIAVNPVVAANTDQLLPAAIHRVGSLRGDLGLNANYVYATRIKGKTLTNAGIEREIAGGDYITGAPDTAGVYTRVLTSGPKMYASPQYVYGNGTTSLLINYTSSAPGNGTLTPEVNWRKVLTVSGTIATIYGSFYGPSMYVLVQETGGGTSSNLYYSLNGVDFVRSGSDRFSTGKVFSANLQGGTFCVWISCGGRHSQSWLTSNSNEFIRYSANVSQISANPWTSATGDMWTSIISAGDLRLWAAGIVYG